MPDPKLAKWRSQADVAAERRANEAAKEARMNDVRTRRADPATLEEVVERLKALEERLL